MDNRSAPCEIGTEECNDCEATDMANLASRYATPDARIERSAGQHDAVMTLADRHRQTFRQIVSRHVVREYRGTNSTDPSKYTSRM